MLRAEWNRAVRARGHNTWDRGNKTIQMTGGRVWKGTDTGRGIRLASLNIQTGREGGLETALWELHQENMNVVFLQETNLTQGIQTWHGAGYNVWETEEESWNRGGVAVVWIAAKV